VRRVGAPIWLAAILTASFLAYLPGTAGPYLADDFANLANNRHLLLDPISWETLKDAAFSSQASPYYRPLSMLSFALGYTAAGSMDPASAKLINVVLHLFVGVLIYLLSAALLPLLRPAASGEFAPRGNEAVALLATAFWLLHPLFVSTVLYTVQRMSILSTLFTVAGCLFYVTRRPGITDSRGCAALVAGIAAFTTLAFLCKENGALLPGFLLIIETAAFRFRFAPGLGRLSRAAIAAMLVLPVVFVLAYLANSYMVNAAVTAPGYYFTAHERLLTQFRVLGLYAGWLSMLSVEPMAIYHDDFRISKALLVPPSTLLFMFFWIGVLIGGVLSANRRHLAGFGILWFLWGHVLESTVLPLAPVFEHRNYLPGFGLLLAFSGISHWALHHTRIAPAVRIVLLALVLIALPLIQTFKRVGAWSDERSYILHSLQTQPDSALTLLSVAVFLDSRGDPEAAHAALREAQRNDPREVALVFAEFALYCEHHAGRPPDAELARRLLAAAAVGPRTATARRQFVEMTKACATVPGADAVLMEVLMLRIQDPRPDVAMISHFGLGTIHLRRGDHAAAVASWQRAVDGYPDGESLQGPLEDLKRRIRIE
jgi:tetratricopeptide (TPR) repeat protein